MATEVWKLFAGQGSWTDGQSSNYMLPPLESIKMAYDLNMHCVQQIETRKCVKYL